MKDGNIHKQPEQGVVVIVQVEGLGRLGSAHQQLLTFLLRGNFNFDPVLAVPFNGRCSCPTLTATV